MEMTQTFPYRKGQEKGHKINWVCGTYYCWGEMGEDWIMKCHVSHIQTNFCSFKRMEYITTNCTGLIGT